jgi:hypothetical protein
LDVISLLLLLEIGRDLTPLVLAAASGRLLDSDVRPGPCAAPRWSWTLRRAPHWCGVRWLYCSPALVGVRWLYCGPTLVRRAVALQWPRTSAACGGSTVAPHYLDTAACPALVWGSVEVVCV